MRSKWAGLILFLGFLSFPLMASEPPKGDEVVQAVASTDDDSTFVVQVVRLAQEPSCADGKGKGACCKEDNCCEDGPCCDDKQCNEKQCDEKPCCQQGCEKGCEAATSSVAKLPEECKIQRAQLNLTQAFVPSLYFPNFSRWLTPSFEGNQQLEISFSIGKKTPSLTLASIAHGKIEDKPCCENAGSQSCNESCSEETCEASKSCEGCSKDNKACGNVAATAVASTLNASTCPCADCKEDGGVVVAKLQKTRSPRCNECGCEDVTELPVMASATDRNGVVCDGDRCYIVNQHRHGDDCASTSTSEDDIHEAIVSPPVARFEIVDNIQFKETNPQQVTIPIQEYVELMSTVARLEERNRSMHEQLESRLAVFEREMEFAVKNAQLQGELASLRRMNDQLMASTKRTQTTTEYNTVPTPNVGYGWTEWYPSTSPVPPTWQPQATPYGTVYNAVPNTPMPNQPVTIRPRLMPVPFAPSVHLSSEAPSPYSQDSCEAKGASCGEELPAAPVAGNQESIDSQKSSEKSVPHTASRKDASSQKK